MDLIESLIRSLVAVVETDGFSLFRELEIGVKAVAGRLAVLICPDEEVSIGGDGGVFRERPFSWITRVIAKVVALQVDRFVGAVVQFDPVVECAVGVSDGPGVAGHEFVDDDGRVRCHGWSDAEGERVEFGAAGVECARLGFVILSFNIVENFLTGFVWWDLTFKGLLLGPRHRDTTERGMFLFGIIEMDGIG